MGVEGDVVTWVADHRKHHQFSDRSGDPHSPHADFGDGALEALKGLWHAHTGWIFSGAGRADRTRYAKDIVRDRGLRVIARLFLPTVVLSLALPAFVGWALIGGWYGFVSGLVWGGAVRIFLLHHVTWSINSICHFWGRRRYDSLMSRGTSGGSPGSPSASLGTTTTTRSRPRRSTDCDASRSIRAAG